MKIRNGFVSNSSSSSFIVISKEGKKDKLYNSETEKTGVFTISAMNGENEFGWMVKKYYDIRDKINFAYLQILYLKDMEIENLKKPNNYSYKNNRKILKQYPPKKCLKMLKDCLKEYYSKIKKIKFDLCIYSDYQDSWNGEGYIDHQSSAYDGKNLEIFDSENNLYYFLFNKKSYIQGGNDNE